MDTRPQQMAKHGHLGGYIYGGDPQTWSPHVWTWAVDALGVRTMLDVGCGEGQAMNWFAANGVEAYGVDGVEQPDPRIATHDYTTGPFDGLPPSFFDLAWSCEFVEHVEERFVPNFLATFARARWVMMTHAAPGQGGWHHVNCRSDDYWVGTMAAVGFRYRKDYSDVTRSLAYVDDPLNHYHRSGQVFERLTAP